MADSKARSLVEHADAFIERAREAGIPIRKVDLVRCPHCGHEVVLLELDPEAAAAENG